MPRRPCPSLAGLALLASLAACGDGAPNPAPPPAAPVTQPAAPGDPPKVPDKPEPRTKEEAEAQRDALMKRLDEQAHQFLDRFRGMIYDPERDGLLRTAEGTADIDVDGVTGRFRFTFDGAKQKDLQVRVEQVRAEEGLHAGAKDQVVRAVYLATRGPYSAVISYAPPIRLQTTRGSDGADIVVAPAFESSASTSYRFDSRGLVTLSGTAGEKEVRRTLFQWLDRSGKWLLVRATEDAGKSVTNWIYKDDRGFALLQEGRIVEGTHSCLVRLAWSKVSKE